MVDELQPIDSEEPVLPKRRLPLQARTSGERASKGGVPKELLASPKLTVLYKYGSGMLSPKQKDAYARAAASDDAALNSRVKLSASDYSILTKYLGTGGAGPGPREADPVLRGIKDVSAAGFGMLGGLSGATMGPAGAQQGGALGVAFGDAFFNSVQNVMIKLFGPLPGSEAADEVAMARIMGGELPERGMSGLDIAKSAAVEGVLDYATAGALARAPAAKNWLKRKILGVTPEARGLVESGTRLSQLGGKTLYERSPFNPKRWIDGKVMEYKGVLPLPLQASESGLIKGYPTVMGRLPFFGGPIKKALASQQEQIKGIINSLPGRVSKTTMTDPELAAKISGRAESFGSTVQTLTNRQVQLNELGEKMGSVIEMPDTKILSDKYIADWQFRTAAGEQPPARVIKLVKEINQKAKLGKLKLSEWNELSNKIQKEIENVEWTRAKGGDELVDLLETARTDLMGAPRIGVRQVSLDKVWEKFLGEHELRSSQKLMMMGNNEFSRMANQIATKDPLTMANMIMKSNDPAKFAARVRTVVGDDAMKELSSRYMDKAIKASRYSQEGKQGLLFDPDMFEKTLGFADKKGKRFAATMEMLRGTGVTEQALDDFIKISKVAGNTPVPDVATFVARRAVLGGLKSGIGSILAGGLISGSTVHAGAGVAAAAGGWVASLPGALATAIMIRKGSKIITNPVHLKLITTALDGSANKVARRSAILRVMKDLAMEEGGVRTAGEMTMPSPGMEGLGGSPEGPEQFMQ